MFDNLEQVIYNKITMKIDIALGIIITLLNKGKTTCKEIAYKYDVSTKTVYRYISLLDTAGIPIVSKSGRYGGISLYNTFRLNNMFLTTQEKMTLVTACSYINNKEIKQSIQNKLLLIK